jgi:hypothetical protein
MAKIIGIVCSVTLLALLSGCGEQLASTAQKVADQITAEAAKTAAQKLDEFKNDTLGQLKLMRGEESNGKTDEKSGRKSDGAANNKTSSKSNW